MIQQIDFQSLVKNPDEFERTKSELKQFILTNFEARHTPISATIGNSFKTELTYGQVLLNLFLLSFYKGRGVNLTENDLFLKTSISAEDISSYLNMVLARIKIDGEDFDRYRLDVYEFLNETSDISAETNILAGNTLDLLDFIEIENHDPEAAALFKAPTIKNLQFNEIEILFKNSGKNIIEYFNNHKERNLSPFTRSNTGINAKQMTQTLSWVGLKPTFDGGVIPKVVTGNFLKGLNLIEDYFISAHGARLALATNYNYVRKSGYFTRKLNLLMADTWHDAEIEDCGTKHYVEYKIENQKKLNLIDGRNYYDLVNGQADYDNLKTIDTKDTSLIGKTIALRSPITCSGNHPGGHICKTCYGKALAEINKHIHTGLNAVLILTERLTQNLLSAKHLLSTNTDKVHWGDDFLDAFIVNMDSIYFNENSNIEITIKYPTDDDYDEDMEAFVVNGFEIKYLDEKKSFHYESPVPLYIKEIDIPKRKNEDEEFKITTDGFGCDKDIFKYIPHNNMLTKSLQNILDLIESSGHLGVKDYNELVNTFADLLIENGLDSINSVHAEMICSKLITDEDENYIDFSQDVLPPHVINRVSKMILKAPISTALSFERLGDQLSNIETYGKDEESIMDSLFA